MNGPVLTLSAVLLAALLVVGFCGLVWPQRLRTMIGLLAGMLSGLVGMLALVVLLLPGPPATLQLPLGLPGFPFSLAIDPLSAGFLLLVAVSGTAAIVFAVETAAAGSRDATPTLAIALAGVLLAVLAGDGMTLALGLSLAGCALWTIAESDQAAGIGTALPGMTLLAAMAVVVAVGMAEPSGGLRFAASGAAAPGPFAAAFADLVAVIGLGALLGLAPLHSWLVPAYRQLPGPAAALLAGGLQPAALYALLRILLGLGHTALPGALPSAGSVPLLLAGAGSVIIGGWRACRDADLDAAAAWGMLRQSGMAALGLGLVLVGRQSDLPDLAALALSAVLLLAAMQAVCGTLTFLAIGAIRQQAGIRRLDRLGGLIHGMPMSTAGLIAGLGGVTGLPLAPGFAALFLLFQALLAGPRGVGLGRPLLLAALALLLALAGVLATIALIRLIGMACLGRPRVPRAAGAEEIASAARPALLVPVGLACLLGLLPGAAVRLLAGTAIRDLTGAQLAEHIGWLTLAPGATAPGYTPVAVALLLALAAGGAFWWTRRRARTDARLAPMWQDGFAAAPPWLPFGDPVTQWNGAVFLPQIPAWLRPPHRGWYRRLQRRATAPVMAIVVTAVLLALLAWPGSP